jgi:hypothetical protein
METSKPEDWISVYVEDDGTMIFGDGRATEDAGETFRKATEKEMERFKKV